LERALNGPLDVQGRNGDLAGEAGCERLEVGQGARRGSHGELTASVCRKHTLRGGGERRQLFETAVQVHRVLALFLFHYAAGASVVPQPPGASAPHSERVGNLLCDFMLWWGRDACARPGRPGMM